jgi:hypothetical protein
MRRINPAFIAWLLQCPLIAPFVQWLRSFPRWNDGFVMPPSVTEKRSPWPGFIAFCILVIIAVTAIVILFRQF